MPDYLLMNNDALSAGDAIAVNMPVTVHVVTIYLGHYTRLCSST